MLEVKKNTGFFGLSTNFLGGKEMPGETNSSTPPSRGGAGGGSRSTGHGADPPQDTGQRAAQPAPQAASPPQDTDQATSQRGIFWSEWTQRRMITLAIAFAIVILALGVFVYMVGKSSSSADPAVKSSQEEEVDLRILYSLIVEKNIGLSKTSSNVGDRTVHIVCKSQPATGKKPVSPSVTPEDFLVAVKALSFNSSFEIVTKNFIVTITVQKKLVKKK
ncbi:MAG TPA: hypothetical protein ENI70_02055 [Candidatus Peregrinibacteria bacterium]|nr:hypothetical protein [Candidatus Peregrinibacteria bacterium]